MTDEDGPLAKKQARESQSSHPLDIPKTKPIQSSVLAQAYVQATMRMGGQENLSYLCEAIHFTTLRREK